MQRAYCVCHTRFVDDAADLDRARRDHLDVDALLAEHGEHLRRDAWVATHSGPDHRHLADRFVGHDAAQRQFGLKRAQSVQCGLEVVGGDGERHVSGLAACDRLVLDDHVDVDVRVGECRRHASGRARGVGHAEQRDARLAAGVGDGGDHRLFHGVLLGDHERSL